ncbi:MAG: hypothetical protein K6G83_08890 [Lachnospiraceae bacterium]|nr:hypothetical protein [Lachnospiraceae bacterium]
MNCQDMNQYIPQFIDDRLAGEKLAPFLYHLKSCGSCYEEMETSYLVAEALSRLEDGEAFNIHEELLQKIRAYEKCVSLYNVFTLTRRFTLLTAAFATAIGIVSLFL